jgi:hypothetical protein
VALLVGALIASAVGLFATVLGLDRDRAFYPVVMIVIASSGVPVWWPEFCLTYDLTAAAYLAWLLTSGRIRAAA